MVLDALQQIYYLSTWSFMDRFLPAITDCAITALYHFETGVATTNLLIAKWNLSLPTSATASPPTGFTFEIISLAHHIDNAFKCRTSMWVLAHVHRAIPRHKFNYHIRFHQISLSTWMSVLTSNSVYVKWVLASIRCEKENLLEHQHTSFSRTWRDHS